MNLKNLDKVWRQNCPEEFNGVTRKTKRPGRWEIMLDNHNRKRLIASSEYQEDQLINNSNLDIVQEWYLLDSMNNLLYSPKSMYLVSTTPS